MLIAALYGRTSNETDDSYSVASQIDAGLIYAASNDLVVPEAFVFREDFTGKALDRPAYNKLRVLIREHKIQAVIVYATDRLARRVSVGEILLDEMMDNGIALHIVAWGQAVRKTPEDRLRFNFEATFSGFEREKIIERTLRGKRKKAASGKLVGSHRAPFGYSFNEHKTNFVLNEYAPIAREVLIRYGVRQMNSLSICKFLEERGYKTPGMVNYEDLMAQYRTKLEAGLLSSDEYAKKEAFALQRRGQLRWYEGILHKILHNYKAYAGTYTVSVDGDTYEVTIPAIITQEEAAAVERMLATGRHKFARKPNVKHEALMARRLHCADHDYVFVSKHNQHGYYYYACSSWRNRAAKRCTNRPVSTRPIDRLTREFVTELLLHPDRLFAWWQVQHTEEAKEQAIQDAQRKDIAARIEQTTDKLHRTLDRLTDALDEDEYTFYTSQRDNLKALLQEYREEYEIASKKRVLPQVDQDVIADFAALGKEYEHTLRTSNDFTFWRGLVDDLDIEGIIGTEGDHRYIDFVVFGKVRQRQYLNSEGGPPSDSSTEENVSVLPCCSARPA